MASRHVPLASALLLGLAHQQNFTSVGTISQGDGRHDVSDIVVHPDPWAFCAKTKQIIYVSNRPINPLPICMSGALLAGFVDIDDFEPPADEEAEAEEGERPAELLVSACCCPWPFSADRGQIGPEEEESESERRAREASEPSAKGFSCSSGSTAILEKNVGWTTIVVVVTRRR